MKKTENYLEKIPLRNENYKWTMDENGVVTVEIENKGIFNRLAQKLLKKPEKSFIHLDDMGSFVWNEIDGKQSVLDISSKVKEKFPDKCEPLYENLAKYINALSNCGFITFVK